MVGVRFKFCTALVPTAKHSGGPPEPATERVIKKDNPKRGFVGSANKTAKIQRAIRMARNQDQEIKENSLS